MSHILEPFASLEIAEKHYHAEGFRVGLCFCDHCESEVFWLIPEGVTPLNMPCPECGVMLFQFYERVFPPSTLNQKQIKTMPPETAAPTAAPKLIDAKEYDKHVNKFFKRKPTDANKHQHSERFQVLEVLPDFNFGSHYGGRKHAFKVSRVFPPNIHTPSCKKFLEDFVPLTDEELAALEPKRAE